MSTAGPPPPGGTPRPGARRGAPAKRSFRPVLLMLGLGAILALVVWGGLVWLAIGFGRDARGGDSTAWASLALASAGAVACLFGSLMLVTTLLRRVGLLAERGGPHRH